MRRFAMARSLASGLSGILVSRKRRAGLVRKATEHSSHSSAEIQSRRRCSMVSAGTSCRRPAGAAARVPEFTVEDVLALGVYFGCFMAWVYGYAQGTRR